MLGTAFKHWRNASETGRKAQVEPSVPNKKAMLMKRIHRDLWLMKIGRWQSAAKRYYLDCLVSRSRQNRKGQALPILAPKMHKKLPLAECGPALFHLIRLCSFDMEQVEKVLTTRKIRKACTDDMVKACWQLWQEWDKFGRLKSLPALFRSHVDRRGDQTRRRQLVVGFEGVMKVGGSFPTWRQHGEEGWLVKCAGEGTSVVVCFRPLMGGMDCLGDSRQRRVRELEESLQAKTSELSTTSQKLRECEQKIQEAQGTRRLSGQGGPANQQQPRDGDQRLQETLQATERELATKSSQLTVMAQQLRVFEQKLRANEVEVATKSAQLASMTQQLQDCEKRLQEAHRARALTHQPRVGEHGQQEAHRLQEALQAKEREVAAKSAQLSSMAQRLQEALQANQQGTPIDQLQADFFEVEGQVDIGEFTEREDDEEVISDLFKKIDSSGEGLISREELETSLGTYTADKELVAALESVLSNKDHGWGDGGISLDVFRKAFGQLPRVKGERVRWAGSLGLHGVLAKLLKRGTVFDGLSGLRELQGVVLESHIREVSSEFARVLPRLLKVHILRLQAKPAAGVSEVQEYISSKFIMDGAFVGHFATLDHFHRGPESLIGVPNPKVLEGAHREHTHRKNARRRFKSSNYGITTWPEQEWEFVNCPKDGVNYPHTPRDKSLWRGAESLEWRGDHGRDVLELEVFLNLPDVARMIKRADLQRAEVICLRLYTGPMFVLYNASLRGFPLGDVECLEGNKYETTIFTIASGIMKLSKVTNIPHDRRLYRGLGGMLLPDHFWRAFSECHAVVLLETDSLASLDTALGAIMLLIKVENKKVLGSEHTLTTRVLVVGDLEGTVLDRGGGEARFQLITPPRMLQAANGGTVRLVVALDVSKFELLEHGLDKLVASKLEAALGGVAKVSLEELADKPVDFKGGVEFGLMSMTTNKETAMAYSGVDKRRGTVFEIAAGRVDVGASVQFLSQYPGEAEYLTQPLCCLEVMGEPWIDRTTKGEVVVVPLRINVNLKGVTVEDLVQRRKNLHLSIFKNLGEELHYEIDGFLDKLPTDTAPAAEVAEETRKAGLYIELEFEELGKVHGKVEADKFNVDDEFKRLLTEAIEVKALAMEKLSFIHHLARDIDRGGGGGSRQAAKKALEAPLKDFARKSLLWELETGIAEVPWKQLEDHAPVVNFGEWSPRGLDSMRLEVVSCALRFHSTFRACLIFENEQNHELILPKGWESDEVVWTEMLLELKPDLPSLLLKLCTRLTSIDLSGNNLGVEGWRVVMDALEPVTSLTSLNKFDVGGLCWGGAKEVDLSRKETGLAAALSRWLPRSASTLASLKLGDNRLGAEGARTISPALEQLTSLQTLYLGGNGLGLEGGAAISSALGKLTSLQTLYLGWNDLGPEGVAEVSPTLTKLASLRELDLRANALGPDGALTLSPSLVAEALHLQKLYIGSGNKLGDQGALHLAAALPRMPSLTYLDIFKGESSIGEAGKAAARRAALPSLTKIL